MKVLYKSNNAEAVNKFTEIAGQLKVSSDTWPLYLKALLECIANEGITQLRIGGSLYEVYAEELETEE